MITLPDGYRAYGRFWPARAARSAVLYHHGIQSHCGWYEQSPGRLAEKGLAVLQVDRRGCGRNELDRGHAESAEQLILDAHALRDELLARAGVGQYHVVGISWGGKLAVAAAVDDSAGLLSLSLVTPGLFPKVGVTREQAAQIGFAMIYEPLRQFDIPLDDPQFFTAIRSWQRFIAEDALTLRQCTASFYLASRRMDKTVARLGQGTPIPIHLLLAGDERIIDNGRTAEFLESLGWPNVRVSRYASARHCLEFGPEQERYFEDLSEFVVEAGAGVTSS